jgi:hypothetical protein
VNEKIHKCYWCGLAARKQIAVPLSPEDNNIQIKNYVEKHYTVGKLFFAV